MLKEWMKEKSIIEASNGKSQLYNTLREGIVIKPIIESYSKDLNGRLILKQRDPVYLSKNEN